MYMYYRMCTLANYVLLAFSAIRTDFMEARIQKHYFQKRQQKNTSPTRDACCATLLPQVWKRMKTFVWSMQAQKRALARSQLYQMLYRIFLLPHQWCHHGGSK